MIYHIEERLPYLTLMGVLNKQNLVTQNIQLNPDTLKMLSLSLLSAPPVFPIQMASELLAATDQVELDWLSRELSTLLISATVRQRGFKDYSNTVIPVTPGPALIKQLVFGMNFKMLFIIEFVFSHSVVFESPMESVDNDDSDGMSFMEDVHFAQKKSFLCRTLVTHYASLEAPCLDAFYVSMRAEWISMCRMFALIKEVHVAFQAKSTDLSKMMRIKVLNLRKIVICYGRSFAYTVQFQWSRDARVYDIFLGVDNVDTCRSSIDTPLINYHNLLLNEIRRYFAQTKSVIALVQMLNCSCVSVFGLARLANLPKFYSKGSIATTIQSYCGFTLIACSLTHFRLFYYSKYCLEIHMKANGLVSIRDGSFGLTDINTAIEELCPIQFLSGFLNIFLDENVQELLRRRASLVEDDNPDSPSSNNNPNFSQQQQQQLNTTQTNTNSQYGQQGSSQPQQSGPGSQHIFLPPTSPALTQSRSAGGTGVAPSPIHHNFFAQSPGLASAPPSNTPSIAQSPGGSGAGVGGATSSGSVPTNTASGVLFANFGSPAIPHTSPANSQILPPASSHSNQQSSSHPSHQHMIQSPSGFMSPAASSQQQNYGTQSPANFSGIEILLLFMKTKTCN